jgi:diacylglycerol kinase family enzyme
LRGRRAIVVERVLDVLRAAGHGVTPVPTPAPGAAGEIAKKSIESGADLIVALGGDGTLNEVLPGVVHSGVPLAVIPAGTANVFARETGLGTNPLKAAARLHELVPRRVAAGLLRCEPGPRDRYFLLMAGIGFDAHIVYNLNLPLKSRMGQLAYWTGAFKQLVRKLDEFEARVDGESFRCSFALASRVRNYAGYLEIARNVSLVRDEFEFVLFEGVSTLRFYSKYLGAVVVGKTSNIKGMRFLRGSKACFSGPTDSRVYVQVDGEYAGRLPASVEIVPEAITILIPPEYPQA